MYGIIEADLLCNDCGKVITKSRIEKRKVLFGLMTLRERIYYCDCGWEGNL